MAVGLFLITLLGFSLLGLPVAFSLAVSAVVLALVQKVSLSIAVAQGINGINSFPLLAIPFYMLLGEIMNRGSIAQRLVKLADALIGFVTGGLGLVAVLASMFMGGISGSAVADSAAIGGILIPSMQRQKYPAKVAGAIVGTASVIGIIIPPSIPFVLFGITTSTSIARMFLGGFVPGIMMGVALGTVVYLQAKRYGYAIPESGFRWRALVESLKESWLSLLIPGIVVGGILGGVFTATEAGAAASAVALLLSFLVYRDLTLGELWRLFKVSAKTTASVLFLVATASITAWLLTIARVPDGILAVLTSVTRSRLGILLLIHAFLLVVGCVMDLTPALLILAPILLPVAEKLGFNPVFFGVTMCINLGIGLVTPPVGTILYIMSGLTKSPVDELVPAMLPYIAAMVVVLLILLLFPPLVTLVPTALMG
ncbi:MAG: TRAP transporter large permease [Betaproteobacteria bacterium]